MSDHRVVVSLFASKPVALNECAGRLPEVSSPERSEWRGVGNIASSILADLDRRRLKLVASPSETQPQAA